MRSLVVFSTLLAGLTPTSSMAEDLLADFYVSPSGDDAWTGTAPEVNTTATDGPFRTFDRARLAVRARIASGMTADVVVAFRGGDYVVENTVSFGRSDSGRDGHRVVYREVPGEEPVFHGGAPLRGWATAGNGFPAGTFRVALAGDLEVHTLYDGAHRARKARHPNAGYSRVAAEVSNDPRTTDDERLRAFQFVAGDVPAVSSVDSLQVVIWPNRGDAIINWDERTRDVASIDAAAHVVHLVNAVPSHLYIGAESRYYVQGRVEFLDARGEFVHDRAVGVLYYLPFDEGSPEGRDIYAPSFVPFVSIRGTSTATVHDLAFEGLTFRHGGAPREDSESAAAFEIENATRDISIERCRFDFMGASAVSIRSAASRHVVRDNLIHDVGANGVVVRGAWNRDVSHEHVVDGNHVFNVGQLAGHGAGVGVKSASRVHVAHNLVHDSRRACIEVVATWTVTEGLTGAESNYTRDNIVEFNDVSHAFTDSEDIGVLYTWGYAWRTIFRNNFVHHSTQSIESGKGIYLDGWTREHLVDSNVICAVGDGTDFIRAALNINGVGHRIVNNVVKNNGIRTQAPWPPYEATYGSVRFPPPQPELHGHSFERNIFFGNGPIQFTSFSWDTDVIAASDRNLFDPATRAKFARLKRTSESAARYVAFDEWQALGFDTNSLAVDPEFESAEGCDIRLRAHSPAFAIGHVPIDTSEIGLRATFPFVCDGATCARDTDLDRIADGADNCALVANPEQIDLDRDELGDACDPSVVIDGGMLDRDAIAWDSIADASAEDRRISDARIDDAALASDADAGSVPDGGVNSACGCRAADTPGPRNARWLVVLVLALPRVRWVLRIGSGTARKGLG